MKFNITLMKVTYDNYYKTENLCGNPYPELIEFFSDFPHKGKVLDLGCGQGRDALPLAGLGYNVTGIDYSKMGIKQMLEAAKKEDLSINGIVTDIYRFDNFAGYKFVLMDSMFHFYKKDRKKETDFIEQIISKIDIGCTLVFCIQDSGTKVKTLNEILSSKKLIPIKNLKFLYVFEDNETGDKSESNYQLIAVKKRVQN